MTTDLSSFLICHNPLAAYLEGMLWQIYHEAKLRFMAALFAVDADKHVELNFDGLNYPFLYVRGDGDYLMYVIVITDIIDRSSTTKLSGMLEQGTIWYVKYLSTNDEKDHAIGSWCTPVDYHSTMPGIQVMRVKNSGALLFFYPGGVRTFKRIEEVGGFLQKTLNYRHPGGLKGMINIYSRTVM